MGHPQHAEDAVQEAFVRIYRGAASLTGRSALSTWIHRIVVNGCLKERRRKQRRAADG